MPWLLVYLHLDDALLIYLDLFSSPSPWHSELGIRKNIVARKKAKVRVWMGFLKGRTLKFSTESDM